MSDFRSEASWQKTEALSFALASTLPGPSRLPEAPHSGGMQPLPVYQARGKCEQARK